MSLSSIVQQLKEKYSWSDLQRIGQNLGLNLARELNLHQLAYDVAHHIEGGGASTLLPNTSQIANIIPPETVESLPGISSDGIYDLDDDLDEFEDSRLRTFDGIYYDLEDERDYMYERPGSNLIPSRDP